MFQKGKKYTLNRRDLRRILFNIESRLTILESALIELATEESEYGTRSQVKLEDSSEYGTCSLG